LHNFPPERYDLWHDPGIPEAGKLLPLLKRFPVKEREAYPMH
jgi:hypothetical protein